MKKRILFINPVGHDTWDRQVKDYLNSTKAEDTEVPFCMQPERFLRRL